LDKPTVLEFLKKTESFAAGCKCVVMTAHASVENSLRRSVAGGALEYLSKPLLIDELLALLRKLTGPRQDTQSQERQHCFTPESAIIGRSSKMLEVLSSRRAGRAQHGQCAHIWPR